MTTETRRIQWLLDARDQSAGAFRGVQSSMERVQATYQRFAGVLATIGGGLFIRQMAQQAMEAEQASNRLDAVLKATRHSAGIAKQDLDEMAESMALATQFDDESIRGAQATLLKFGNIQEDVFRRAMKAAADYAAFTGTNIPEAAQTIGKALQSPAEGTMMLERQIGKLTFTQKENIKTLMEQGRLLEAQAEILKIVEGRVGGTAEIMNTGLTGAVRGAAKAWGELLETLGKTAQVNGMLQGLAFLFQDIKDTIEGTRNPLRELLLDLADLLDKIPAMRVLTALGSGTSGLRESLTRSSVTGTIRNPAAEAQALAEAAKAAREQAARDAMAEQAAADAKKRAAEGRAAAAKALAEEKKLLDEGTKGWIAYADAVFSAADAEAKALSAGESFTQWAEKYRDKVLDDIDATRAWNREMQDLVTLLNTGYLNIQQFNQAAMSPQLRRLVNPGKTDMDVLNEALKEGDISLEKYLEVSKRINGEFDTMKKTSEDIGLIFSSAASDAFRNWQGVGNLIRSIGTDIAQLIFRKNVAEPIASAIGGFNWGSLFSGGASLIGATASASAADGGSFGIGDRVLVGERGPEIVDFTRPGTVIPNHALAKSSGPTYHIDARGADAAEIRRLEILIGRLNSSIEPRAVAAVASWRDRGGRV